MSEGQSTGQTVDVSFVVIGFNEAATLPDTFRSVREARLPDGVTCELIYADAMSTDDSIAIAETSGVDAVVGGEKRRRAAENRNLGLARARGRYVQFLDGDMVMHPDWPATAMRFLDEHEDVACIYGRIVERSTGLLARVLELDWIHPVGDVAYSGGAAMYRREPLLAAGAFPEDVRYGEEPLLCWRLRNEHAQRIYRLDDEMCQHDLGFTGLRDYLRRTLRVGETYIEIATRTRGTRDPMWVRQTIGNFAWLAIFVVAVALLVFGGWAGRVLVLGAALLLLARKLAQTRSRSGTFGVAAIYAVHTYAARVILGLGQLRWLLRAESP